MIFKNGSLGFYEKDTLRKNKVYKLIGKPATGLGGYGNVFYVSLDKKQKKYGVKFYQNYKVLTISYDGIKSFFLVNDEEKSYMDSLFINGIVKEKISNRFSIQRIDSVL